MRVGFLPAILQVKLRCTPSSVPRIILANTQAPAPNNIIACTTLCAIPFLEILKMILKEPMCVRGFGLCSYFPYLVLGKPCRISIRSLGSTSCLPSRSPVDMSAGGPRDADPGPKLSNSDSTKNRDLFLFLNTGSFE